MREHVEFVCSLGLNREDLATYPLALGCSVRKNMVPVLDYLGKSGVRRDELPHLLCRYPSAPSPSAPQPLLSTTATIPLSPTHCALTTRDIGERSKCRGVQNSSDSGVRWGGARWHHGELSTASDPPFRVPDGVEQE